MPSFVALFNVRSSSGRLREKADAGLYPRLQRKPAAEGKRFASGRMVTHPFQADNARISTFASVFFRSAASTRTQMPGASPGLEGGLPVILRRNNRGFRAHELGDQRRQLVHILLRKTVRREESPPACVV